jgi:hypothetical protein
MSEAKGRVRYILTRLCLNTGSIAVLKYLESMLPSEGFMLAVTESGEEIKLTASTTEKRVYGLTDYFAKRGLNVNDQLFITVIGEKLQLESIARNRDAKPDLERPAQNSTPVIPKAKFERQIIEESAYVREVREVKVSPYPKGILYPRSNETSENGASKLETTESGVTPEPQVSEMLVAREPPISPAKQATPFEVMLENVHTSFTALGYVVSALESGLLLETKLGRLGHRVALAVTDGRLESDAMNSILKAGRVTGVKYLAVAAPRDVLGFLEPSAAFGRVCKVELESLSDLRDLAKLFSFGPLELEGYWNAGNINTETLESLEANVQSQIQSRGLFSFITLALNHFDAPRIITPEEIQDKLSATGITTGTITEVLETLSKPPFNLLSPMGVGEYHLRASLERGLSDVAEYVSSLRMRLRHPVVNASVETETVSSGK